MSSDPAHRVLLCLPECLEAIFLELDNATLLTSAQLVCKSWLSAVQDSRRLQRKLFFAPISRPEAGGTRTPNPLLQHKFPAFFNTGLRSRIIREEVLQNLGGAKTKDRKVNAQRLKALLCEGASWRRMYPEAPISYKIGVVESRGNSELSFYSQVLDVPEGVTMGKLYDFAYSMHLGRAMEGGWFGVYWREKSQDPQVNNYSWNALEEVALSRFAEDVRIVLCPRVRGEGALPSTKKKLKARYMPAEFELCTINLEFASAQDLFG